MVKIGKLLTNIFHLLNQIRNIKIKLYKKTYYLIFRCNLSNTAKHSNQRKKLHNSALRTGTLHRKPFESNWTLLGHSINKLLRLLWGVLLTFRLFFPESVLGAINKTNAFFLTYLSLFYILLLY
jgi:hypothetical protein